MSMRCFKCADEIEIRGRGKAVAAIYNDKDRLERDGYVKSNCRDQYGWDVYELRDYVFDRETGRFVKPEYPYYIAQYKYALYAPY